MLSEPQNSLLHRDRDLSCDTVDHVKVGLLFFVAFAIVLRFGTDLSLGLSMSTQCPDFQVQAWLKKMR